MRLLPLDVAILGGTIAAISLRAVTSQIVNEECCAFLIIVVKIMYLWDLLRQRVVEECC